MLGTGSEQSFWKTSAGQKILTLDFILRKISDAQHSFIQQATQHGVNIACPPACGACCRGFMPDVLPIEADYIAYFLLKIDIKYLLAPSHSSTCPFYNASKSGENCSIYEARPLVCRLFGFSSTKSKSGEAVFRLCRFMPTPQGIHKRTLDHAVLMNTIGSALPSMTDFTIEALAIDPLYASDRKPLIEALPRALERIRSILQFCSLEDEPNAA